VAVEADAPRRRVPRSSEPLVVAMSAPGYHSVRLEVLPDQDRSLVVALAPVPSAVAPSSKSTPRAPAAHPSGVIRRYPF
jgi:hypothetical protein